MTFRVAELAQEIHSNAAEKGFWDQERNMGEMLMLVVSELAEALEEHRDGKPPIYSGEGGKPEGTVIELADAVIRCLDTLYAKWSFHDSIDEAIEARRGAAEDGGGRYYKLTPNFGENLLNIVDITARANQHYIWLATVVVMCERLSAWLGVPDIWVAVRLKMDYNLTRPHKHGKAY